MAKKDINPTEFESPCKVNRTGEELKIPSFNETISVMKNYTLKQKLKAKNIVQLEINSFNYPLNYEQTVELLNKYKNIADLKISEVLQILEYCDNDYTLERIYNIFAATEKEVEQIQTDLKSYINKPF